MKTLNVKIPLSIAKEMDDRGQLNPIWLSRFIEDILPNIEGKPMKVIKELTFNYTFKIDNYAHKQVKLKGIEFDLAMNELVGRLLAEYY